MGSDLLGLKAPPPRNVTPTCRTLYNRNLERQTTEGKVLENAGNSQKIDILEVSSRKSQVGDSKQLFKGHPGCQIPGCWNVGTK